MKAYLYARVSSREQEREGFSIPAQRKLLREYASEKGLSIAREFTDVETAKSPGRKDFRELLRLLEHDSSCRVVLVEKTDRLYRNPADTWRVAELIQSKGVELHLVKEGMVISNESRSQDKFMHDIHVAIAKHYIDNLREEVKKGMQEKAEEGMYPGRAPFGYKNDQATRTIIPHPERAPIVARMFEAYDSGGHSVLTIRNLVRDEFALTLPKSQVHHILRNSFYTGLFEWGGKTYKGTHRPIVGADQFQRVQEGLDGRGHPKQRSHRFAFGGGLLRCAFDGCTVTAELHKGKYVYYRCTFSKGKCGLPYMPEAKLADQLGNVLDSIVVPDEVASAVVESIRADSNGLESKRQEQLSQVRQRLSALQTRIDKIYEDKLDGNIDDDFWSRKTAECREQQVRLESALSSLNTPVSAADRALSAQRILELAKKARFLYVSRNPTERGELLRTVLLNCSTDGVTLWPTYRKPFDAIFERVKTQEWSGREDLNLRPPGPEPGALPG